MKIIIHDLIRDESIVLNAHLTTNHPASSYNQPVMLIEEWEGDIRGNVMSHQNWILCGAKMIWTDDDSEEEREMFKKWYSLIEAMYPTEGGSHE